MKFAGIFVAQILLIILKIVGVMRWSWFVIMAPLVFVLGVIGFLGMLYVLSGMRSKV